MSACLRSLIGVVAVALVTLPGILARGDGGGFGRLGGYHGGNGYGGGSSGYTYRQTQAVAEYPSAGSAVAPETTGEEPTDFYAEAMAAFRAGRYADSARLARSAAASRPSDPDVHLLLTLGSFAVGQYDRAAKEAHAVASLGQIPDWPKLYAIYGNVDTYTCQLRALEQFAAKSPTAVEGRFLLGFQYAMLGHRGAARPQFLAALNLARQDRVAAGLLTSQGGAVPPQIAALQRESKPATVARD